jgi:hypothetical protein
MKGGRTSLSTITLCTGARSRSGSLRDAYTDTMNSDIVTSSRGDKIRTRSATKAILDFEGNLWLKLPKLGRKAMLGMMEGREVTRLDTAMVQWEGRQALL